MKKHIKSYVLLTIIMGYLILLSCHKKKNDVTNISAHGESSSHNAGQNCMNCHKQGGDGKGWFQIAGTVYNAAQTSTNPNTTVDLYTGPNGTGTKKYTIQVDALGNFYTTENIDFGNGLYPAVQGATLTKYMPTAITTGQCISCHGTSTGKIWTE